MPLAIGCQKHFEDFGARPLSRGYAARVKEGTRRWPHSKVTCGRSFRFNARVRPSHCGSTGITPINILIIHLLAALAFVPWFFSWTGVVTCLVGLYVFGTLGINLGYHRLLTHRSFVVPKRLEHFFRNLGRLLFAGFAGPLGGHSSFAPINIPTINPIPIVPW